MTNTWTSQAASGITAEEILDAAAEDQPVWSTRDVLRICAEHGLSAADLDDELFNRAIDPGAAARSWRAGVVLEWLGY